MTTPSSIISEAIWSILGNVNTAIPGIVKEYDSTTNKATIQPALNRNYESGPMEMPLLKNVPVIFPSTSQFSITFPIREGDYVLLIFCERSIDLWKSVGGQVTPDDRRKFHLSDAVAIPGLKPFTEDFTQNNGNDFLISYAGSTIRIKENGDVVIDTAGTIAIGNSTVELLQEISDTLAGIAAITVTVPPGDNPPVPFPIDNAATFTAIKSQIDSIKGSIP